MFPSVLQTIMASANWKPAIDRDPTPWLDALATHHYPLFPAAEALLASYGGCAFTTAAWHDTAFELTDTLDGIFEWTSSEIELSIDPYRALALTEATIWQTHPYILHTRLQLAPIGQSATQPRITHRFLCCRMVLLCRANGDLIGLIGSFLVFQY
ncbi:hypothetical protein [Herpetosiphon sp. NSE202]|uniref:hypothetical protein n=1 Tax=Herpetosiphon sp. NSE202 TaxID=3351349 RepID=UPI00362D608A